METKHDKTIKMMCALTEDSDQLGRPPGWADPSLNLAPISLLVLSCGEAMVYHLSSEN